MKKSRLIKKYILICALILFVIGALVGILIFLNNNKNSYTLLEKRWLNENSSSVIKVKVDNTIPIFSYDGEGLIYDYLSNLEKDTNLSFDIVTTGTGDYEFSASSDRNKENLLFYTDTYSVVTDKSIEIKSLNDLKDKRIGVLKNELYNISYYFSDKADLNIKTYDAFDKLKAGLEKEIDLMIVPTNKYLNVILNENYNILYQLDGLNQYYELDLSAGKKELNSVMKKFMNKWDDKYKEDYNENLLNLYTTNKNISEMDIEAITSKDLIVGYVKNLPFEGNIQKSFTGITNEYLKGFGEFSGATYKYVNYKNVDALKKALDNRKVDIVMNYSNIINNNYNSSKYVTASDYVVLAHESNDIVVDNIYSLKNNEVNMLKNNNLTKAFKKENIFIINESDDVKDLLKDINKNSIIIIDKIVYEANKTKKLKEYSIRYMSDNFAGYNFLTDNNKGNLSQMFNFYLMTVSSKQLVENATYNTVKDIRNSTLLGFVLTNIVYFILFAVIIFLVVVKYRKRVKVQKKIKREDKMMYIDVMTNLKNRNFLNDNMELWDSNKVYPQTVIVIDLKGIKEINDTNGHEEGDRQIKAAANILIKTQRENSEIIRTDGNEFLIYLVGYNEKIITTYLHKLNKEFKNLPYDFGANFGYSMINDEIKSLDDAINESLIMMNDNN